MMFTTTALTLAVSFGSAAAAAMSPTMRDVVEGEIATHRNTIMGTLKSRHQYRRLHGSNGNGGGLRALQTACDTAYDALYEDEALNTASTEWLADFEAMFFNLDFTACEETATSIDCDVSAELAGTQELKDACTAAGGTPVGLELDVACTITLEGDSFGFSMNTPTVWECSPPNCEEELDDVYNEVVASTQSDLTAAFASAGGTASCEVGDLGGGGSSSGGGGSTGEVTIGDGTTNGDSTGGGTFGSDTSTGTTTGSDTSTGTTTGSDTSTGTTTGSETSTGTTTGSGSAAGVSGSAGATIHLLPVTLLLAVGAAVIAL